ncbi:MAG: hypothetical protein GXY18_11130 [Methanomicrobiales archaeon]|nr:hypothetical protein [Methanomicrobiales archaeon]
MIRKHLSIDGENRISELIALMAQPPSHDPEMIKKVTYDLVRVVASALMRLRENNPRFGESECSILGEASTVPMGRKEANAFLCACFLEIRSGNTDIWDNVEFFAEEVLDDPENLWQSILDHTEEGWNERFFDYNLHPDEKVHARIYHIANLIVRFYAGDGRQIWMGYEQDPESVYKRLLMLQIPRSIACLIVGILKDKGYIQGPFDIVGDIVDSRVLGRMICGDGSSITPMKARRLARMIAPVDPWVLDRPLYLIGSSWCGPGPKCRACPVRDVCVFSIFEERGIRPDPIFRDHLFGKKSVQKTLKKWQDPDMDHSLDRQ